MPSRKVRTYSGDEELVHKRREHIAEKSMTVFLRKGYDKATMRDLGTACGLAPGSIYHYIGSKKDILHLILKMTALGSSFMKNFRSKLTDASYASILSKCVTAYYQNCDSRSKGLRLIARETSSFSSEDRQLTGSHGDDIESFFEELLKEGMETGEFQISNPKLIANNILFLGHEWALRKRRLERYFTLEEYTKEQIELLLKLVTKRES